MELNRKTTKKLIWLIVFAVLLYSIFENFEKVIEVAGLLLGILTPFLIGLAAAFVINVPMRFIEQRLLKDRRKFHLPPKLKRPFSLILTLVFVAGVLSVVIFLLVPELANTFGMLKETVPVFIQNMQSWALQFSDEFPQITDWVLSVNPDWNKITALLSNSATNVINSTVNAVSTVVSGTIDFFMGLIFAFYLLLQKEKLALQAKRFLYAFFPEQKITKLLSVGRLANKIFSGFISGQCTEAVILGLLCFIGMSIFRFPYALMISVLVGFLSLIPIFGAFIAAGIGTFLILMVSPFKALLFLVFFIVLQQLEGNLIYPRVVGNSIGLPAIWVLAAVILGSSTIGIFGILLFIPLCSLIYALLRKAVPRRLAEKEILPE